jgi:hypothetical protein
MAYGHNSRGVEVIEYYILNPDRSVSETKSLEEAFHGDRIIDKTKIGKNEVSTVFLGINHNFSMRGRPILFETMIFPDCEYVTRCASYDEALEMHKKACESLLKSDGPHPLIE